MAGIAFLNVVNPKWVKKIDLKKLDLSSTNTCVIGEVFGNYHDGINKMDLDSSQAETLGFYLQEDNDYGLLTKTWKSVIQKIKRKKV